MRQALYLDTARLGCMSPQAQRMFQGFGRLVAEAPAGLNVEDFLRQGFAAFSDDEQRRYAELSAWPGLAGLKDTLRRFVGATADAPVLISGRSQSLMRLAARCLFQRSRNVLTTDLSWPTYQRLLEDEARRTGQEVTQIAVRERLFRREISLRQIPDELSQAARRFRSDGLFLPAVDNLGVRVPIADIVAAIRPQAGLQFVVTDAAQAIGHVPLSSDIEVSDMLIAGTHKWLGGYLPLGLAFLSSRCSSGSIVATCQQMRDNEDFEDPLLDFLADLESQSLRQHTETVNLTPLLTCCGALESFGNPGQQVEVTLPHQLMNAGEIRSLAESVGWQPLWAATDQRTGIVLLKSETPDIRLLSAEALRRRMQQAGIAATAYAGGIVRLAMPRTRHTPDAALRVQSALRAIHKTNAPRFRKSSVSALQETSHSTV